MEEPPPLTDNSDDQMSDIDPYYSDCSSDCDNQMKQTPSGDENGVKLLNERVRHDSDIVKANGCEAAFHSEGDDNFEILYDRTSSSEMDIDTSLDVEKSDVILGAAESVLNHAVDNLEKEDLEEARNHCRQAFAFLNDIKDPGLIPNMLMAYNTCSSIFQQCEDHEFALRAYYKAFWLRRLDPYPLHASEVLIFWIPVLESVNYIKLFHFMRELKSETDKKLVEDLANCKKALHIYLDLNLSYRSLHTNPQLKATVSEDVKCVLIQIAKCFLILGKNQDACNILRDVHNNFPAVVKGVSNMVGESLLMWGKALFNLKKFGVAGKKLAECLEFSDSQEVKHEAKKLLKQIHVKEEQQRKEEENRTVDSDDEYVQGSNYRTLEQQHQRAEEYKAKHKTKGSRHRPKRQTEPEQDYLLNSKWTDIPKNRSSRKRHHTASSIESQTTSDKPEAVFTEAHDNSDIEDDIEFDNMSSKSDMLYSDNEEVGNEQTSDDYTGMDHEDTSNVNQFERSSKLYDQGANDLLNEDRLLQTGISLSDSFVDSFRNPAANKSHFTYPKFYSEEENAKLCRQNPKKFKKCRVRIETSHGAVCTNLDHSDEIQEIEISGRSKIGKVFNDDEVYVEILSDEKDAYRNKNYIPRLQKTLDLTKMNLKVFGQIRGVIGSHQHHNVDNPVFVCVLDEQEYHLMLPISKTVPKLHVLNKNCNSRYQVDVYSYEEARGELKPKEIFTIKPGETKNYIFLVAMICWENLYPLGAVIKVINAKDGMSSGMEILRLHHQVPTGYKFETVEQVKELIEPRQTAKVYVEESREDITELEVFTIDPPNSRDLDDALSIEHKEDGNFRIGIHIADVTSVVKKGDYVDGEAYERATTFYPGQGRNPYHMLPEPLSSNLCSLIQDEARPAISIFFLCDQNGQPLEKPEIKKTVIKNHRKLTYRDAQDIILNIKRDDIPEAIYQQTRALFRIAHERRTKRLGGGMYHVPIETGDDDDDFLETKEAHYLVEEYMILANHAVGTFLFRKFKDCIPLRTQPPPEPERVQEWLSANAFSSDLILKLQEIRPLPNLEKSRKLSVEGARTGRYNKVLMFQQFVWLKLLEAVSKRDLSTTMKILGCDESHPFSCLGLEEWYEFQELAEYKCSGEITSKNQGMHFSLGIFPYIHFTSPIRRYVDIISHRLLHCALDERGPCYTKEEVIEMCLHINDVTRRAKAYEKKCRALIWGYKLRKESKMFHGFVKSVSDKEVTVVIPGHRKLPKESTTLQLNILGARKKPVLKKDVVTEKEILELQWKERLYAFNGYSPISAPRDESKVYRVNPHNKGFFQQQNKWKKLLEIVVDTEKTPQNKMKLIEKLLLANGDLGHSRTNLDEYVPACHKVHNDVSSEVRKGTITLQSCDFSLSFNHGQILALQMSAESTKGVLVPQIEIFDMTKNVKRCLLHAKDPIKCLERYSTTSTKDSYPRPVDYIRTWKPLIEMEAATNAINGDTATINDVPVKFLSQKEGKFSLRKAFLDQRNLEINKVPLEVYLNRGRPTVKNEEDQEEEDEIREIASPDYLCIKSVVCHKDVESSKGTQFGNTHDLDPNHYVLWNAHAKIARCHIQSKKGKIDFIFKLHRDSKPVPEEFKKEDAKTRCSIEILFKSSADCRIDSVLQCLDKASPLAKAIALGNKIPKNDKGHFEIGRKMEPDIFNIRGIVPNNPKQLEAIQKALTSSFSLIQGPPGTGKTYTGIKLVYLFNKINIKWQALGNAKKQIIFCGPSNKSVDLVARWMKKKLGDHCPKMVRWYGSSIEDQEFPIPGKTPSLGRGERAVADEALREHSMHILIRQLGKPHQEDITAFDRKFRQNPDGVDYKDVQKYRQLVRKAVLEEVTHYDVIFCTTAMATNLKVMEGTCGRIYQIIIDESGMCTEPESMAAIIASRAEQVVLIGDHKQLRPIVMSNHAAKLGLETSLFERYARKATMLTSQYRMNPRICDFPSKQFYKNKLETMPSEAWRTNAPLKSWIKPGVPVVFINIEGTEEYLPFNTDEGNEQSCSNKEEVQQVVKVFKHLVDEEVIDPHYINIMSQYNSQCHCIREDLKKEKFIQFNVNTVVASQGGEWDYVILSLVRSLPDYRIEPKPTIGWCKQNLGFITDENQTNVALTRARKGLIVIGNQKLLKCNEVWSNFLDHYGKIGCVVDSNKYPPVPIRIQEKKQKKKAKKARNVQATDEEFYRGTDQDPNINETDNRPE